MGLGSSYYSDLSMYNALADTGQQAQGMGVEDGDILSSSNAVYEPMVQGSLGYNTTQTATNPWAWGVTDWISAGMMGVGLGFGGYNMAKNNAAQLFQSSSDAKIKMAGMFGIDTTDYEKKVSEKTTADSKVEDLSKEWGKSKEKKDAKTAAKKATSKANKVGKDLDKSIAATQTDENLIKFKLNDNLSTASKDTVIDTNAKPTVTAELNRKTCTIPLDADDAVQFKKNQDILADKNSGPWSKKKAQKANNKLLKNAAQKAANVGTTSKGALFKQSWKGGLASNICMNVLNVGVTGFTEYQQTGEIGKQTTKALVTGIVNTLATTTLTAACSIIPGGPVVAAIVGTVAGGAITTGINKLSSWICSKIPGWSDEEIAQENAEKAAKKNGTYVDPSQAQAQPQASGPAVITSSQLEAQLSQMTSDEQATFMAQLQEAIQAGQIVLQ